MTDGGKCSANGDAITPEPVKAEGENARRRKKEQRDIFPPHAISGRRAEGRRDEIAMRTEVVQA